MKTSDKVLLELAAKAAGYDFYLDSDGDFYIHNHRGLAEYFWNPLTDDGDALQLAVRFDMDILLGNDECVAGSSRRTQVTEPYSDNKYSATRRAIVRAAAEIGKEMK